MKYLFLSITLATIAAGQTLTVTEQKPLWRDGHGKIEITDSGIHYTADDEKDSRVWSWLDVQYFDRISPTEFVILTYEDEKLRLGQDRQYHFKLDEGELTDATFATISARLKRPVTDRVVPRTTNASYTIPVKHLHAFGGCEGELEFAKDAIYYRTDNEKDAREWQLGRDVESVWSDDPYHLEIYVADNNRREFSRTRVYRFDLKERLDPEFYRSLKLRLYRLDSVRK